MKQYKSKAAQETQQTQYGDKSYWDYLEEFSLSQHQFFTERKMYTIVNHMLIRSLTEALQGQ